MGFTELRVAYQLLIYYSKRYVSRGLLPTKNNRPLRVRNILMLIIIINIRHTNSNMFISIRVGVVFAVYCEPFITMYPCTAMNYAFESNRYTCNSE